MAKSWSPSSWQSFPVQQQPDWPDQGHLDRALKQLSTYPPLVFAGEARTLTTSLGHVANGRAFLLQAGDCAESFDDFSAVSIREKLKVILQMAIILTYSEPVEPLFSTIQVTDATGTRVEDGKPVAGNGGRILTVKLRPLVPGVYAVAWRVTSVDTHKTEGQFTFTVKR